MTQCRTASAIIEENATRNTCANLPRVGTNIRTNTRRLTRHFGIRLRFNPIATALTVLAACVCTLLAQPISVPNFSFELQSAAGFPFDTNPDVDSWQKIAEPAYYASLGSGVPPWYGTAGVFDDTNPQNPTHYANRIGSQAGYILAAPQVTLFQDYNSSPTHDFDATFEVGKSYKLTVGIFGKPTLADGSTLELSLYYLDGTDSMVPFTPTVITYSSTIFQPSPTPSFIDYEVNIPTVQAGDAWAGRHIGIQLESTVPVELTSFGNWDFDNVRLTAVPEPASITLLGMGLGGLLMMRARARRRA
jgi:HpiC1 cyclase/PEP-CTERM motif